MRDTDYKRLSRTYFDEEEDEEEDEEDMGLCTECASEGDFVPSHGTYGEEGKEVPLCQGCKDRLGYDDDGTKRE